MKFNKGFKKAILAFGLILSLGLLSGCDKKEEQAAKNNESKKEEVKIGSLITKGEIKDQLAPPAKGEEIAVIKVKDYGEIKCRLFPEVAPCAVENFKKFAKEGRYNNSTFHRVIEDFMVQAGKEADEKKEGREDVKRTQVELNPSVHHLNGALCMARDKDLKKGQGCQFYIVSSETGKTADFNKIKEKANEFYKKEELNVNVDFNENTKKLYKEHGGRPDLDMMYTVFGQVFQGQEVVKKIEKAPKKEKNETKEKQELNQINSGEKSVTKDPIVIEKVEIVKV